MEQGAGSRDEYREAERNQNEADWCDIHRGQCRGHSWFRSVLSGLAAFRAVELIPDHACWNEPIPGTIRGFEPSCGIGATTIRPPYDSTNRSSAASLPRKSQSLTKTSGRKRSMVDSITPSSDAIT